MLDATAMRWGFATLLAVHGLVHTLGFARAFGLADLTGLTQPISRPLGALWLVAGIAFVAGSGLFAASWPFWWALAGIAVVLSQIAIGASWRDAKYATVVNALVLAGVILGATGAGPAFFGKHGQMRTTASVAPETAIDAELAGLPAPLRRCLLAAGVTGRPRPAQVHACLRAGSGPSAP